MKTQLGLFIELPFESLKPALLVSLLSVWVLVGLFFYLNHYTRRRYFTTWTAAWLFYALWLTLCLRGSGEDQPQWLRLLQQTCVGVAAVFLLWGAAQFLRLRSSRRQFGWFLLFQFVWSYIGVYHMDDPFWSQSPMFGLIGLASVVTAWTFYKMRTRRNFIGAGLLCFGFIFWGVFLAMYPLLQTSGLLLSSLFFISAVLQLFIAVSMIVLVLEEVRTQRTHAARKLAFKQNETDWLRKKMLSTEERYRSLFDQASEGIVIASSDGLRILELNQTARRLLGVNGGEPSHQSLIEFCEAALREAPPQASAAGWFERLCQTRRFNLVRRDGQTTPVEVDGAPIQFEGQTAYQFFFRELTERARLEQQLRQAEKLSALGQMISGVAHELNNPLAVIKGYLELILARHPLQPQTRVDLEKVAHESNRAAKLVSNFLSFAREQPVNRQQVELNELIHRVLELRQFDLRVAGTEVILHLDPELPPTQADADQIQQVLVNLVTNALQAMVEMPRKSRLTITTRRQGEMIQVIVEDNGPGVPESVLPHIFEPFFTTKEVGTGTGLGLSIAHSIMSDHKGRIEYQPSTEGGAGFLLELPIVTDAPPIPESPSETKPAAQSPGPVTGSILVLDDEKSIAELLGEILEMLGYQVTLSCSPPHALELLDRTRFDLVLSDFRMPFMDGQQFYEQVTQKHPDMRHRIIFLTGDVVTAETQAFLQSTGNPHLPKPFKVDSVERVVAETLARAAEGPVRALESVSGASR